MASISVMKSEENAMLWLIVGFIAGLIIGWNFLPQPEAIKNLIASIIAKIKS